MSYFPRRFFAARYFSRYFGAFGAPPSLLSGPQLLLKAFRCLDATPLIRLLDSTPRFRLVTTTPTLHLLPTTPRFRPINTDPQLNPVES